MNQPEHYFDLLEKIPNSISIKEKLRGEIDFIHFFTKNKKDCLAILPKLKKHLSKNGMLWISWPKKASKIPTDINEDIIRSIALSCGLVDVKVCAIDESWSGLKLVYRLKDR